MSRFLRVLRFKDTGGYPYTLISPLLYRSARLGLVHIPTGFKTDLASIPWFVQPLFGFARVGRFDRAAVVHDYLYATQWLPRSRCDAVLLEAMLADQVSPFVAYQIWLGVRVGGWWAWRNDHKFVGHFRHYR